MRVVVQKTKEASVIVEDRLINKIDSGLVVLIGFTETDNEAIIDKMINKITKLRIFEDENNIMNLSVIDLKKEILAISQFTLYGNPYNGNRPSYIEALNGEKAKPLYDYFIKECNKIVPTYPGIFGADMKISLINDGPTTIIIDSANF
ncbi:MAG: D-tyrosyl-tRNA(Tyr) deacylase [Bacilli bacterium]|nr:D-tyrosyl-tRNA(Tyr) deacylase [Bacilli bacterium]